MPKISNIRDPCFPSESKRLKSKSLDSSENFLPRDIVYNILLCLPVETLYKVMRHVCREWYSIIRTPTFIDAHLLKSDRGSLIWTGGRKLSVSWVEIGGCGVFKTKLRFSDFPGFILSSCNGLVWFVADRLSNHYIANPLTNEISTIPSPLVTRIMCPWLSSLGYSTTFKKYKLVEFFGGLMKLECAILTLGVDKEWRCLGNINEILKIHVFPGDLFLHSPINVDGFLHWPNYSYNLTLDLETETFFTRAVPEYCESQKRVYLGTGRSLTFVDLKENFSWDVWLLTNEQTGEWTKLATIDFRHQIQWLRQSLCPREFELGPVGWLKDGEIAIFKVGYRNPIENQTVSEDKPQPLRNCITYNMKTGAIKSFQLDDDEDCSWSGIFVPHVKSLVSLKFAASISERISGKGLTQLQVCNNSINVDAD